MFFLLGDLSFVIHFQMPGNIIKYYQEIGRAGRKIDNAYAVLLVGEEDREISEYFIENAFPKRQQLENILSIIENSYSGLNINELCKVVNMTQSAIKKCLSLLDLNKIIAKDKSKYFRTTYPYNYEDFKVEEVLETRYKELALMEDYINTEECYMKFLANELDDATGNECGKCCNCINKKYFPSEVEKDSILKAENFLKNRVIKITPRKQWPAGVVGAGMKRIPKDKLNEVGRVLADYGDFGYGEIIEQDKYKNNYFRDELVTATIDVIRNKWAELTHIDCVAAVPSLRRPELVKSFAKRVAKELGVEFIDIIVKPKETEQQKVMENSNMQARNAYNAFKVIKNVNYDNVLLANLIMIVMLLCFCAVILL